MEGKELVVSTGVQAIEQNSITVFTIMFGFVLFFVLYIWKDKEKRNNERHEESEIKHKETSEIIQKLIDLQQAQQILLTKFEAKFELMDK